MWFVVKVGSMVFLTRAPSMRAALETALLDEHSSLALAGFEAGAGVKLTEELGKQEFFFEFGKFSITYVKKMIEYDSEAEV